MYVGALIWNTNLIFMQGSFISNPVVLCVYSMNHCVHHPTAFIVWMNIPSIMIQYIIHNTRSTALIPLRTFVTGFVTPSHHTIIFVPNVQCFQGTSSMMVLSSMFAAGNASWPFLCRNSRVCPTHIVWLSTLFRNYRTISLFCWNCTCVVMSSCAGFWILLKSTNRFFLILLLKIYRALPEQHMYRLREDVMIHFSISIFFSEVLICIPDIYSYFFPRMFPTTPPIIFLSSSEAFSFSPYD